MGKRLTAIVAGVAVLALVVVAVVALATQTGPASAQVAQPDTGAAVGASVQTDAAGQDCGDCAGQAEGAATQGSGDGAAQECTGCDAQGAQADGQTAGQAGQSGDGEACCPY